MWYYDLRAGEFRYVDEERLTIVARITLRGDMFVDADLDMDQSTIDALYRTFEGEAISAMAPPIPRGQEKGQEL